MSWRRIELAAGILFTSVTHDSEGFLAVGSPLADAPPSLWRSTDGLSWRQLPMGPASASAFTADASHLFRIARVARSGNTLVAVGMRQLLDGSSADPAAWVSTDGGGSWRRAIGAGFTDGTIDDVTAGPNGWVAVGSDGYTFHAGFPTRGAAVWTSPDGENWARAPTQSAFAGGRMSRVVTGGSGYIATGFAFLSPPAGAAQSYAIWRSADGRLWSRPLLEHAASNASATLARWRGSDFAYLTPFEGGATSVWRSPDGLRWTNEGALPPSIEVDVPLALADRLLAVGRSESSDGTWSVTLATSADGLQWQKAPQIDTFAAASVADGVVADDRVVLVGQNADPRATDQAGYVWVGTPVMP